jgi:hypothetical protein
MALSDIYYKIADLLDELPEDELAALLRLVQSRMDAIEHMKRYDPAKDPVLTGADLFDGPGDLSERVEEILYVSDVPEDEPTS